MSVLASWMLLVSLAAAQADSWQPVAPASQPAAQATAQPGAPPPQTAVPPAHAAALDAAFDKDEDDWKDEAATVREAERFVPPSPLKLFRENLKREYLNLSLHLMAIAGVQEVPDSRFDGITLFMARAALAGHLDGGFEYQLTLDGATTPAMVDAWAAYQPLPAVGIAVGRMKVPVSAEMMVNDQDIELVDRAEAVLALAPDRAVGLRLQGRMLDDRLRYWLGAFSAERMERLDWGRGMLYAGRIEGSSGTLNAGQPLKLDAGIGAAYSYRDRIDFTGKRFFATGSDFLGSRLVGSANLRLNYGPLWAAGELLYARYAPASDLSTAWAAGGYGELGVSLLHDMVLVQARYDHLYAVSSVPPHSALTPVRHQPFIVGGLTVKPSDFCLIVVSYAWGTVPGITLSRNQLLAALLFTI